LRRGVRRSTNVNTTRALRIDDPSTEEMPDPRPVDPVRQVTESSTQNDIRLARALKALSDVERNVVMLHIGIRPDLAPCRGLGTREIERKLGIAESSVRFIRDRALRKLYDVYREEPELAERADAAAERWQVRAESLTELVG
jgi:DNA-directed RNA polymerase sigma subunit (sigma70/sigma32)